MDYSKLDFALTINNLHEEDDSNILFGCALPHEKVEELIVDIRELVETKYQGATFEELFDNDANDESLKASLIYHESKKA